MKITTKEGTNTIARLGNLRAYDVELSHDMISAVDDDENFCDIVPRAIVRYKASEAEELVEALKKAFPFYYTDPYYHSGPAVYPVHANIPKSKLIRKKWKDGITLYRYKLAGEWIYGITNEDTDEPNRYLEASMDGWEKWLDDRHRILQQAWDARYNPMI